MEQNNYLLVNKNKEPYKDHLCDFHALAIYMNGHSDLDSHTSRYFTEFTTKSGQDPKSFHGVLVQDLLVVERKLCKETSSYTISVSTKVNM